MSDNPWIGFIKDANWVALSQQPLHIVSQDGYDVDGGGLGILSGIQQVSGFKGKVSIAHPKDVENEAARERMGTRKADEPSITDQTNFWLDEMKRVHITGDFAQAVQNVANGQSIANDNGGHAAQQSTRASGKGKRSK